MSISPATRTFIEVRAICQLCENNRPSFLEPSPALVKTIAEKLAPYADDIAPYGKPPAMQDAWGVIANDTGSRDEQINLDMLDIAKIATAANAYVTSPDKAHIDTIQRARMMLRSQAFPPQLRKLGEAAAIAVAKPDFKKDSFTPSL